MPDNSIIASNATKDSAASMTKAKKRRIEAKVDFNRDFELNKAEFLEGNIISYVEGADLPFPESLLEQFKIHLDAGGQPDFLGAAWNGSEQKLAISSGRKAWFCFEGHLNQELSVSRYKVRFARHLAKQMIVLNYILADGILRHLLLRPKPGASYRILHNGQLLTLSTWYVWKPGRTLGEQRDDTYPAV